MNASGGGLFLSCGEISGDIYAAGTVQALRSLGYDGPVSGMGGPRASEAGTEIFRDFRELHLMGISDVLPAIPRLLRLRKELVERVFEIRPDALLVIDSPDFHLPFVSSLRKKGWKGPVIYAVTPTVWAWRPGRVKKLARDVDLCLPLFSFEYEFLLRSGVASAWSGHPLTDEFASFIPRKEEPGRIALLPGSRRSEITRLLPPLLECARLLRERGFHPVFSIAPGLSPELRSWMVHALKDEDVWEEDGRSLLSSSIAAAGASGTASVEAMMLGRFMAVLYRGSFLSWLAWKTLVNTRFISIPNIIAGEEVYPEFIQERATGLNVFHALERFLRGGEYACHVRRSLALAKEAMGTTGAFRFWAGRIEEYLSAGETSRKRMVRS